ncbi:MAG TPA: hypothetical protein DIU23_01055 [Candidatus Pacebacteria bacterium]|nr:hypothetical protein [Candidatus Paceibacterota bacterium]
MKGVVPGAINGTVQITKINTGKFEGMFKKAEKVETKPVETEPAKIEEKTEKPIKVEAKIEEKKVEKAE